MARYYASALTSIERAALGRGDQNHNLKSWALRDLVLHEQARKDLKPTNTYIGPDKKLFHRDAASRSSRAPQISPPVPVMKTNVHGRAVSSGGYFTDRRRTSYPISGSCVRSPLAVEVVNYKPSDNVTSDKFLEPHRSGKGEAYRDAGL